MVVPSRLFHRIVVLAGVLCAMGLPALAVLLPTPPVNRTPVRATAYCGDIKVSNVMTAQVHVDDKVIRLNRDGIEDGLANFLYLDPGSHGLSASFVDKKWSIRYVELIPAGEASGPRSYPNARGVVTVTTGKHQVETLEIAVETCQSGDVPLTLRVSRVCKSAQAWAPVPAWNANIVIGTKVFIVDIAGHATGTVPAGDHRVSAFHEELATIGWRNKLYGPEPSGGGQWHPDNGAVVPFTPGRPEGDDLDLRIEESCPPIGRPTQAHLDEFRYGVAKVTPGVVLWRDGKPLPVTLDTVIGHGDFIATPENGALLLQLKPTSAESPEVHVLVHPASTLRLQVLNDQGEASVHFAIMGTVTRRSRAGKDWAVIRSTYYEDKQTFADPNGEGQPEGTFFTWTYDKATMSTTVTVEQGGVRVRPRAPGAVPIVIPAGRQLVVTRGRPGPLRTPPPVKPIDFGNGLSLKAEPPQQRPEWFSSGTGDCGGRDIARTMGSARPDPQQCTPGNEGRIAICWDGAQMSNIGTAGPWCTYKQREAAPCTGGSSPGFRYVCAPGR